VVAANSVSRYGLPDLSALPTHIYAVEILYTHDRIGTHITQPPSLPWKGYTHGMASIHLTDCSDQYLFYLSLSGNLLYTLHFLLWIVK